MRFPFRLTTDVALGVAARALRVKRNRPLIQKLIPTESFNLQIGPIGSPVVWVGGAESLQNPDIAIIANTLVAARRHVFLETNGALLRKRIHEFRPCDRLHLTVRFDGCEAFHDARAGHEGSFRAALEGIRAAQLSGFLICAHLILHADHGIDDVAQLQTRLRRFDIDAFLITPSAPTSELQLEAANARRRLLGRRCALFSSLLETILLPTTRLGAEQVQSSPLVPRTSDAYEEGIPSP